MKKLLLLLALSLVCLIGCKVTSNNLLDPAIPSYYRSNNKYKNLIVEIIGSLDYIPQQGNVSASIEKIRPFLSKNSITFYNNTLPNGIINPKHWTESDISEIITKYRKNISTNDTIVFYVVGVPGTFEKDTNTGGLSYSFDRIVIFKDIFHGVSEYDVILHEMGHSCLGLVNNGTSLKSDHEDKNSAGHCKNPKCVMYFLQNGATEFDDACLKDLK